MNSSVYINNALSSQIHSISIMPGLATGLVNGLVRGISAAKHGGNFWTGDGMMTEMISTNQDDSIISKTIELSEGMQYNNEFVDNIAKSNYSDVQRENTNLIANGTLGSREHKFIGEYVLNNHGEEVLGLTKYIGSGNYDVYIYKAACVSMEQLVSTLGHEYLHVAYMRIGATNFMSREAIHSQIYAWQKDNALKYGSKELYSKYKLNFGMFNSKFSYDDVSPARLGFDAIRKIVSKRSFIY